MSVRNLPDRHPLDAKQNYRRCMAAKGAKMNDKKILGLVYGAMTAAIYAAATYLSSVFGIAYGPIQFRFSEVLTVLSLFTPAAIPGLAVGCIIGNLASPFGVWDIVFGSAATFLASITARRLREIKIKKIPIFSLLMPVIFNALIVGAEITFLFPTSKTGFAAFVLSAAQVAAGEAAVILLGGIPFYFALRKTKLFK